jgi:hypothetical protein
MLRGGWPDKCNTPLHTYVILFPKLAIEAAEIVPMWRSVKTSK